MKLERPQVPRQILVEDAGRAVVVTWRDGRVDRHGARALRLVCPCAKCVHEITGEPLLDPASVAADVAITDQQTIGNYATRFAFSDGHSTGLFTHQHLRTLGGG
ncbi:MAG TPA: DUF971 domain-containing protein [Planctomycetota bacterium]|nr:DUF971 domain-containing protein [Planctomycetota bacterium]